MSAASRPPSKLLIFSITAVTILGNALIVSSLPDILRDLGVDESRAGLVVAAGPLPGIVVAPAIGFLADRFGRRRVVVPCLVIFGLAGAAASASPSFEVLVLLRAVQGLGSAGLINLVIVVIADHWDGRDRSRLIGYNSAVITTGVALYPVLGGGITDLVGWRWVFLTYLAALVVALGVVRGLEEVPVEARPMGPEIRRAVRLVGQLPYRVLFPLNAMAFALVFGLFLANLPVHLDEEFGLGPTARGLVVGVPAVTSTIAALAVGRLREVVSARVLLAAGYAVFASAFVVMGVGPLAVVLVAAAFYGFAEGSVMPTIQDVVAERAPARNRGAMIALLVGAARFGQVLGPGLVSWALLGASSGTVFVFAALAPALAAALVLLRRRWLVPTADPAPALVP